MLLISASSVARIIDVSLKAPAPGLKVKFLKVNFNKIMTHFLGGRIGV
jgi:hypothetical protein